MKIDVSAPAAKSTWAFAKPKKTKSIGSSRNAPILEGRSTVKVARERSPFFPIRLFLVKLCLLCALLFSWNSAATAQSAYFGEGLISAHTTAGDFVGGFFYFSNSPVFCGTATDCIFGTTVTLAGGSIALTCAQVGGGEGTFSDACTTNRGNQVQVIASGGTVVNGLTVYSVTGTATYAGNPAVTVPLAPGGQMSVSVTPCPSYDCPVGQPTGPNYSPPQILTTSLPTATSGVAYNTQLLATGGSGTGYGWSLAAGSLPNGFTLSSSGVISSTGNPAAAVGSYTFTVEAVDLLAGFATQQLTLKVNEASDPTSPPTFIDPVPDLLNNGRITTSATPTDPTSAPPYLNDLSKGHTVQGLAADGVAQVVIRIPASFVGQQFELAVDTSQCTLASLTAAQCIDQYGLVFDPTNPPDGLFSNAPTNVISTVYAVATDLGPIAFAAYRSPVDFVRSGIFNGADATAAERSVNIIINQGQNANLSMTIVRPPVIFIHGIASDSNTWNYFEPLIIDQRFRFCYVDYSSTNLARLSVNAPIVGHQIATCINSFSQSYAAVQADTVVHSMGGLLVRTFSNLPNFAISNNYTQGPVHKLITIGTPHWGTPLATALQLASPLCAAESTPLIIADLIGAGVAAINNIDSLGGLADLAANSPAVLAISTPNPHRVNPLIRAHVIVGLQSSLQDMTNSASVTSLFEGYCPLLTQLLANGFSGFYGTSNDVAVPDTSQQAVGLGFVDPNAFGTLSPLAVDNIATATRVQDVIHSVFKNVLPLGPDELAKSLDASGNPIGVPSLIPPDVIDLLNSPITGTSFAWIVP